jgi:hypothetical protein
VTAGCVDLVALAHLMRLFLLENRRWTWRVHAAGNSGRPDFLWSSVALAHLMRLSLLKAADAAVGECHVAGNSGRPSFSAHVRCCERGHRPVPIGFSKDSDPASRNSGPVGQSKHKCPNRLRKLIRLINGYQVPTIANDRDVCSRCPGENFTPVLLQRILPVRRLASSLQCAGRREPGDADWRSRSTWQPQSASVSEPGRDSAAQWI